MFAPVTEKNARCALSSKRPLFSIATIVFSKVGADGLSAIACTSLRSSAIPASIAGW